MSNSNRPGKLVHAEIPGERSFTAEEVARYRSNDLLILGTVAIQVGDEIWVGGVAEGDNPSTDRNSSIRFWIARGFRRPPRTPRNKGPDGVNVCGYRAT